MEYFEFVVEFFENSLTAGEMPQKLLMEFLKKKKSPGISEEFLMEFLGNFK